MTDHLANIADRTALIELVEREFPGGCGVEIGVASGCFTRLILDTWESCDLLYCVDLWRHQPEGYIDGCNAPDDVQEERYQQFIRDFGQDSRIVVVRDWSHRAAKLIDEMLFDFAYIDANHAYLNVMQDIRCWWPKIMRGGILAGHDYASGPDDRYNVKRAVDEFAMENDLRLYTTRNEYRGEQWEGFSWMLRKP